MSDTNSQAGIRVRRRFDRPPPATTALGAGLPTPPYTRPKISHPPPIIHDHTHKLSVLRSPFVILHPGEDPMTNGERGTENEEKTARHPPPHHHAIAYHYAKSLSTLGVLVLL